MFLEILNILVLLALCILIFIDIRYYYKVLKQAKQYSKEEETTENDYEETGLYSIRDFRKRMEKLKEEDFEYFDGVPLYTPKKEELFPNPSSGVEIITDDMEIYMDEKYRR